MANVAERIKAELNKEVNFNGKTNVEYLEPSQQFRITSTEPDRIITVLADPSNGLSLIGAYSSLVLDDRAGLVSEAIKLVDQYTAEIVARSDDPDKWKALQGTRSFRLALDDPETLKKVTPDFSGVTTMEQVATKIQDAIRAEFPTGTWGDTQVTYNSDKKTFVIKTGDRVGGRKEIKKIQRIYE